MQNYEILLSELKEICEEYIDDLTFIGRKDELPKIETLISKLRKETYGLAGEAYIDEKIDEILDQCHYLANNRKMTHPEEQHQAWLHGAIRKTEKAFCMSLE